METATTFPKTWVTQKASDLADFIRGISWRSSEANTKGEGMPVLSIPNIQRDGIDWGTKYFLTKSVPDKYLVNENDILFVGSSGSIKNVARNYLVKKIPPGKQYTFASFTFKATPKTTKILPAFLYYLLNSKQADFQTYSRKAADGKFNFQLSNFKEAQEFVIPKDFSEQNNIATILSKIQEAIENQDRIIKTTTELKAALMKKIFTEGLNGEPLKETEIGKIPKSWEVKKIGDFCNVFSGFAFKSSDFTKSGIPVVKIGDLQGGKITFSERTSFVPQNFIDKKGVSRFRLNDGDLLIAMTGATTGKSAQVASDVGICLLNQRVGKFDIDEKVVSRDFVKYLIQTGNVQDNVQNQILKSAQGNISPQSIMNIKVPFPAIDAQKEIGKTLSAVDAKIENSKKLTSAKTDLFKSMLNNLMSGEIRVNNITL